MTIIELLEEKATRGTCFCRASWPEGEYVVVRKPPWSDQLRMYRENTNDDKYDEVQWQPTIEDLLATDWKFYP